jgi:hypothetical protein
MIIKCNIRSLPRIIPEGFEGIAISNFNLGTAIPAQAPSADAGTQGAIPVHGRNYQYQHRYSTGAPEVQAAAPVQNFQEQQQPQQSQTHQIFYEQGQVYETPQPFFQQRSTIQQQQQRLLPQRQQQQQQAPVAQETFQIDNFLTPGDDTPTSYQNTQFGHQQFLSHKFVRNPTVEQATAFDETLPEDLRNPFYRYV